MYSSPSGVSLPARSNEPSASVVMVPPWYPVSPSHWVVEVGRIPFGVGALEDGHIGVGRQITAGDGHVDLLTAVERTRAVGLFGEHCRCDLGRRGVRGTDQDGDQTGDDRHDQQEPTHQLQDPRRSVPPDSLKCRSIRRWLLFLT